jgi:hypothetical protein
MISVRAFLLDEFDVNAISNTGTPETEMKRE